MDMIAIREAWQQAARRETHQVCDLPRLRARIFFGNQLADRSPAR